MANLKVGNTNVGRISVVEPYDDSTPSDNDETQPWVRPAEWLDLPVINSGDDRIAMLMYITSGIDISVDIEIHGTYVSLYERPTYSVVDWGDGNNSVIYGDDIRTSQPGYIGYASHTYKYEDISADTEFVRNGETCRQFIIDIDNVSGCYNANLSRLRVNDLDGYTNAARKSVYTNLLDIHVASQNLEYINLRDQYRGYPGQVEHVKIDTPSPLASNINMSLLFGYMHNLQSLEVPRYLTSGVTNMQWAFTECHKLKSVSLDTSSATNFYQSFRYCFSLENVDADFNNVTSLFNTFIYCSSLKEIPLSGISNCDARSCFQNCTSIKKIPDNFTITNSNCDALFNTCTDLKAIPENFFDNCSGITNASSMFARCNSLRKVPTINLPDATEMGSFLAVCPKLRSVKIGNVNSIGNGNYGFRYMFSECKSLTSVTFEDPENATPNDILAMFNECESLEFAPYFNTSSVTEAGSMFNYCYSLKEIPKYDFTSCTGMNNFAYQCFSLEKVGGFENAINMQACRSAFYNCLSLNKLPSGINDRPETILKAPNTTSSSFVDSVRISEEIPEIYVSGSSAYLYFYRSQLKSINGLNIIAPSDLGRMFEACPIIKIPETDASLVTSFYRTFYGAGWLEWSGLSGVQVSIDYSNCYFGSGAIRDVVDRLASGVVGQTVNFTGNYGTEILHPDTIAIGTSKGWTVTT